MYMGYNMNLKYMPQYFIDLGNQALKQLNDDDVKSIIKSRTICESILEKSYDRHRCDIIYEMR